MGVLKRLDSKSVSENGNRATDPLTLYDQYGSMAYGVILQIIPQPEVAQKVLIDLFTSPQESIGAGSSTNLACAIIRLARTKALEVKASTDATTSLSKPISIEGDHIPKFIFDLSFRQGYTPGVIAERLQMPYIDVMKAIRDYFKYLRIP